MNPSLGLVGGILPPTLRPGMGQRKPLEREPFGDSLDLCGTVNKIPPP